MDEERRRPDEEVSWMSLPQIRKLAGEVPGPGSRALEERRRRAVARGVATLQPVYAAAAHGAVLEDVDGNRFIDFTGGLGVLNPRPTPPAGLGPGQAPG